MDVGCHVVGVNVSLCFGGFPGPCYTLCPPVVLVFLRPLCSLPSCVSVVGWLPGMVTCC